jgi:hypothetical protein
LNLSRSTGMNRSLAARASPVRVNRSIAMAITRKQFLESVTGSTVALLVQGCGGGGYSGGMTASGGYNPPPASACGAAGTLISGNHGHVLVIATADLNSTVAKDYSIMGTATHDHTVTLTAADFAQLKLGNTVMVTSTMTDAVGIGLHAHNLTVSCM